MTPHPTRWYQCYHASINWWENSPTITYLEKNILCAEENSKHYIWRKLDTAHPLVISLWWSVVVASSCYGVLLSGRDEDTGHNRGEWLLQPNKERVLEENLHQTAQNREFIFQHDGDPKHTAKTPDKSECLWVARPKPKLQPHGTSGRNVKFVVHRCSPFNLIKLERIRQKEWEKLLKSRCANLVQSYPRIG